MCWEHKDFFSFTPFVNALFRSNDRVMWRHNYTSLLVISHLETIRGHNMKNLFSATNAPDHLLSWLFCNKMIQHSEALAVNIRKLLDCTATNTEMSGDVSHQSISKRFKQHLVSQTKHAYHKEWFCGFNFRGFHVCTGDVYILGMAWQR